MGAVEITTEVVPLTNPRALLGVIAHLIFSAINLGGGAGVERPADVVAQAGGRVVGRRRVWNAESLVAVVAAMRQDAETLSVDEFRGRWL